MILIGVLVFGVGIVVVVVVLVVIGVIFENLKNLGKLLIFVVLGEGVVIYGMLIFILILNMILVIV